MRAVDGQKVCDTFRNTFSKSQKCVSNACALR